VDNHIGRISFPFDKLVPKAPSMKDHKSEQKKKVNGWHRSQYISRHQRFTGFLIEHYAGNFPL